MVEKSHDVEEKTDTSEPPKVDLGVMRKMFSYRSYQNGDT